jgi:mono/diheme cytochrome c family protein
MTLSRRRRVVGSDRNGGDTVPYFKGVSMRHVLMGTATAAVLLAGVAHSALAQEPEGQEIYRDECKSCHGLNGVPPARAREQYKRIRALGDSGFVVRLSTDSIVAILKKGISKDMKSFKDKLSEPDMRAVAKYIKELAEKKAP